MKQLGVALMMVLTAAAASGAETAVFSVTLPGGFPEFQQTRSQSAEVPQGKIETTNWVSRSPKGEAVVVTVSRMPGKLGTPASLLSGTRDSLMKAFNASLEKELNLPGSYPATSLTFKANSSPLFYRAKLMVVGNTIYQILYAGRSAEQRSAAPVGRVFDTFLIK